MAKLLFNESTVNDAIDQLSQSQTTISGIQTGMASGISLITGARGANYLDTSKLSSTAQTPDLCIEQIRATIEDIQGKAEEVKKYNEEYENMSWGRKLFSSLGLALTKITQGFFTAGEQIVDGFASILGAVVGVVSPSAKEKIGEFVKKDHVGDFYNNLYNTSLKGMVHASLFREDSIVAKGFEIVGTAIGYSVAMNVAGNALGIATKVSAVAPTQNTLSGLAKYALNVATDQATLFAGATTALGGLGAGTQANLKAGKTFDESFKAGLKTGAVTGMFTIGASALVSTLSVAGKNAWHAFKARHAGSGPAAEATAGGGSGGPQGGPEGSGGSGSGAETTFNGKGNSAPGSEVGDDLVNSIDDATNASAKAGDAAADAQKAAEEARQSVADAMRGGDKAASDAAINEAKSVAQKAMEQTDDAVKAAKDALAKAEANATDAFQAQYDDLYNAMKSGKISRKEFGEAVNKIHPDVAPEVKAAKEALERAQNAHAAAEAAFY